MEHEKIFNKITEVLEELSLINDNKQILVMHPSTLYLIKDYVIRYHDIYNTREAFMLQGGVPIFLTFNLPLNNFAFMTNAEYEENYNPKN